MRRLSGGLRGVGDGDDGSRNGDGDREEEQVVIKGIRGMYMREMERTGRLKGGC